MKRFESAIRTIAAFFAVLLGFGLKRLLDDDGAFRPDGAQYACFLACIPLFLRFLLGSSNHMWFEFVRPDLKADAPAWPHSLWRIVNDFAFLVVFGIVCMAMCYSAQLGRTLHSHLALFLAFNAGLAVMAIVWGLVYDHSGANEWKFWIRINFGHFVAVCVAWLLLPAEWTRFAPWSGVPAAPTASAWAWIGPMALLVAAYVALLVVDLKGQFDLLAKATASAPPPAG